ncbi:peptidyl-prolyl cis-trans isomerase [candidate division WOR-3 bacterium]|nr:peptidyl-prolyl cis-trans isomerase [candidate division WOR-3 bacterium]
MFFILALAMALPQDYVNLVMKAQYEDAIAYCDNMIQKNKDPYQWKLEKGDIYYSKLLDFEKATEVYRDVVDNYEHKDGWAYYRLAQVLEMTEDFLNSARQYEIVATRFRKVPLDSFSLSGVERCFKKNYQDYVATVSGYNITRLELDEKTGRGGQFARPDERAVLDQMITERLIYASAVAHDIEKTEFFQDNFKIRGKLLLLDEIRAYEVMEKITPTEKQMKKYYKENKDNYKIREQVMGKEIVVESDSLARVLLDSLKKDIASFDTLAKLHSIESNARNGGNMGIVYRERKPEAVEAALFTTEPKNLTDIIDFDGKYGIYYVTAYKPERYRDFDEVSKQIESQVRAANIAKEEEAFKQRLKKKSKQKIHDDSIVAVLKDTSEQSKGVVVAEVNGRMVTWGDVIHRNEAMTPQFAKLDLTKPDKVEELINTVFDEELRLELAWRNKYFLHDGYFVQLKDAIKTIMDQGLYRKMVLDAIVIDSQGIAQHYEEHIEEFKMPESARVHEILLGTKELAEKVHELVMASPESFDSLTAEYSVGPSSLRGGETGLIRRGMMGEEYDSILFSLEIGDVSDVFSVKENTWTIIKMVEYTPEHYRDLAEVENIIESRIKREKQSELANNFLTEMREEADIQVFLPEPEEAAEQEAPGEE